MSVQQLFPLGCALELVALSKKSTPRSESEFIMKNAMRPYLEQKLRSLWFSRTVCCVRFFKKYAIPKITVAIENCNDVCSKSLQSPSVSPSAFKVAKNEMSMSPKSYEPWTTIAGKIIRPKEWSASFSRVRSRIPMLWIASQNVQTLDWVRKK